ncbi:MAG: hypothetical protein Q9162_005331 [Coniocarpon cinnabarinum]
MRTVHTRSYLNSLRVPPRSSSSLALRSFHHEHRASNRLPGLTPVIPKKSNVQPQKAVRAMSSAPPLRKDHHFDTLKFTQRLREEGLSEPQAEALMKVLSAVLEESIQNLTRTMVPREDALKTAYTQKIDFNALRTELLQSDTSESTLTKTTHDRLQNEVAKLGQRLRDEVERTKSGVKLDLNLEKGRMKDEREAMEMKIRETETRIDQEVAALQERVAGVKFDTVRWLAGVVTGTMALLLGAWRLFM